MTAELNIALNLSGSSMLLIQFLKITVLLDQMSTFINTYFTFGFKSSFVTQ